MSPMRGAHVASNVAARGAGSARRIGPSADTLQRQKRRTSTICRIDPAHRPRSGHNPRKTGRPQHKAPHPPPPAAAAVEAPTAPTVPDEPSLIQSLPVAAPSLQIAVVEGAEDADEVHTLLDMDTGRTRLVDVWEADALRRAYKPGQADDAYFEQHWSVALWRSWSWPPKGGALDTPDGLRIVAQELPKHLEAANMARDPTSAAYWAYHIARTAWFLAQGTAGMLVQSVSSGDIWRGEAAFLTGKAPLRSIVNGLALRMPAESMGAFHQDLALIREGVFKLPWDMTSPRHRQYNPLYLADQARRFLREASSILTARFAGQEADEMNRVPFRRSNLYPEYYQYNFHYQTDGWFSSNSAKVYDASTESFFMGRQDAMQRSTLIPIARAHPNTDGAGLRMLEVAAGTGRLATFVRDNYPEAHLTVSDLSPFYLQQARETVAHWQELCGRARPQTDFVQCAAESLPLPSESFDVVYCCYMFHEVPDDAREAALQEMTRVLKPGGVLVMTDSVQLGDRPEHDSAMIKGTFTELNEPHYPSYIQFDFGERFRAMGMQPGMKILQSYTKTLSATKSLQ